VLGSLWSGVLSSEDAERRKQLKQTMDKIIPRSTEESKLTTGDMYMCVAQTYAELRM